MPATGTVQECLSAKNKKKMDIQTVCSNLSTFLWFFMLLRRALPS